MGEFRRGPGVGPGPSVGMRIGYASVPAYFSSSAQVSAGNFFCQSL